MRKEIRKITALFCLLAVMLVPCQAVFAAESDIEYAASPRMTHIVDYAIGFAIRDCVADVEVEVSGNVLDATRAKVIAELQVKSGSNWIPVAIWTDDQDNYKARVHEYHDVVKGHTYRVKGTFMVWEGSAYETEYDFSDEITA